MNDPRAAEWGLTATLVVRRGAFCLDVAVTLPARGVSVIFGPSGAGKTTFLRCVAGLDRPERAHIAVASQVWQDDARSVFVPVHRRALGYVFQDDALFPHLSVADNVDFGMKRVPLAARRVSRPRTIELLGLGDLLNRRPSELSGGERKRVALGRALLTSPDLLLLDEPLSGLDAAARLAVLGYVDLVRQELGIPMIYVSHGLDEVLRLADHLVLLEAGRVVDAGPLGEVTARGFQLPGNNSIDDRC